MRPVARSLAKRATEKWAQEAEKFGASAKAERLRQDLPHKQKRQRRAQRNQERPDKEFQPINRGHIARPQIVPTRHGGNPPSPWQSDPNAEPRLRFRRRPTIVQRRGYRSVGCGDCSVQVFTQTSDGGRQSAVKLLFKRDNAPAHAYYLARITGAPAIMAPLQRGRFPCHYSCSSRRCNTCIVTTGRLSNGSAKLAPARACMPTPVPEPVTAPVTW